MRGICGVFEGKRRGPGQPPAGRKWRQAAGRERAGLSAHGLAVHLMVIFQFFSLDNVSEPQKSMNCKEKDPEVGHTLAAKPTSPVRSQSSHTLAPLVRSPQPRCSGVRQDELGRGSCRDTGTHSTQVSKHRIVQELRKHVFYFPFL